MNKKLISFLAATAMIVTVSQESMALVGEAVSNGNVAIEQEMESDDVTQEANTTEDTQVSDTNAVEVSTWDELKTEISNANENVKKTIILVNDVKAEANTPITIDKGKKITIVGKKGDSGVVIERGTREPKEGEFVVNENAQLTISGKITIKSHDTSDYYKGVLTTANFIKVNQDGFLNIKGEITTSTNKKNGEGGFGLIYCTNGGKMEINTGANISGWVSDADSNEKQAAVVVDGVGSELTMNDGVVRDNYNTGANSVVGAAIQVRDGAKFVMNGGDITENGKVPNDHGGDNVINGSGVYINGAGSTFIMNGGTISNNIGYNGAGIYIKGKNKTEKPKLIINNGNISGNKLVNLEKNENLGGGIYAENAEIDIEGKNNIIDISKNGANEFSQYRSVNSFGGGLYLYNCSGNIKKVLISKNIIDGSNEQGGAGLCISNSNINIEETEIKENQSGDTNRLCGAGLLIKAKYSSDNSDVKLKNVLITENKVSPNANLGQDNFTYGGGIFIKGNNATLTLEDCDVSMNETGYKGAGIYIDKGNVILTGNTNIKDNIIELKDGESGDKAGYGKGIFVARDGKLEISKDIKINEENDIYLEKGTFINVTSKLNKINTENPISITSAEENIEDENTEGTKLVEYSEAAGGEAEAKKATLGRYFIPSKYMDQNLKIGQSQKTKNILTYVKELPQNTPPVINATDKEIFVGDNFNPLKDVTATDAEDGTITLTPNNIEENTVDISKPGEYKITYTVTDSAGVTTTKTIKVTVKAKSTGGGGGTVTPPTKPEEPDRIEGGDRIETSVESSKDLYPNGTNAVVLANCERYTDVLTADPFAIQEKASALLTYKDKLPEKTLKEIERLGAKKIYISGGYDAVSKKVVDELANRGYEIFRFDGIDRYDTARKIAIKIREKGNTNAAELASGENYPDALCMTPLAVKDHAPILLTKKDSIPKYTKQALAEWDIENIKIGGLDEAVSKEVEKQLKAGFEIEKNNKKDSNVYDGAKAIKRIGGEDRYETSAKLAAESYPDSKLGVYATGEDFPDALIAGNYAGTKEAPVLLVKKDTLPEPIEKYTKESKIKKATIIGGVNAVSDKVLNLIKDAIRK